MPPIRLATLDDVPSILAISNESARTSAANFSVEPESLESWQQSWRAAQAAYPWLVASDDRDGSSVIGFVKASPWKGRCAYDWTVEVTVYVNPAHHRRGIGTALYAKLFSILKAQGYHNAIAGITLPNPASVRLHESFGMKHIGTFPAVGWKFGCWHDVGYWSVALQDRNEAPVAIAPVAEVIARVD